MINEIVSRIENNDVSWVNSHSYIIGINHLCLSILNNKNHLNEFEYKALCDILYILNSIYESFGESLIDDDVYDSLQNIYQNYNNGEQFKNCKNLMTDYNKSVITSFSKDNFTPMDYSQTEYFNNFNPNINKDKKLLFKFRDSNLEKELYHKTDLVGTLDKCKFVLCSDVNPNIINDSNITILERDFFGKHIKDGILDPNRTFSVLCELKYDGASIETEISRGSIVSAITRGDLYQNKGVNRLSAVDFKYFENHFKANIEDDIVKFEAIVTYEDMNLFNMRTGSNYKNPRTCISGIMNRLDAHLYSDYITLIPLKSEKFSYLNRAEEIEMLNKLYSTRININGLYIIFRGDYISVLYQIKQYMLEAEKMRDYLPFMYDGIVISYLDEDIKNKLGRVNHVDKFSMALKFPSLSKLTKFIRYFFTVGKDGRITPMAEFELIDFLGTTHNIASLHSYKRYKELGLVKGETIRVDYVNDCMAYISKYEDTINEVPDIICPSCGYEVTIVKEMAYCPNINCDGRNIARVTDMLAKLGFMGISDSFVINTGIRTLSQLCNINEDFLRNCGFGEVQIVNIIEEIKRAQLNNIMDYDFIGAFGFLGVSSERFKIILSQYNLDELFNICEENDTIKLTSIKGIGDIIAFNIIEGMKYFKEDILYSVKYFNVIESKRLYNDNLIQVRFSGIRDNELLSLLNSNGYDAGYSSVTKETKYLIVPDENYNSNNVSKAKKYGVTIIPIYEARNVLL